MDIPTFDRDGYPTDATIDYLETCAELAAGLDFMRAAWYYPTAATNDISAHEAAIVHADQETRYLRLATGGWSGNESLIAAWKRNRVAWMMTWELSARGGLYIFRYR